MNRKQYLISVIVLGVGGIALIVTNYVWQYMNQIYPVVIVLVGYLFLKYKLTAPMQLFTTKFSMLVDYDLDVEGAVAMAEKAYVDAPTNAMKAIYQTYYGMGLYYAGRYQEAIKILQTIDLKKLNIVYHGLIWAFVCYSAYETEDMETFQMTLDRIKNIHHQIPARYQGFIGGYIEILEAIKNIDVSLDQYKETIEKHFSREDGYISTKLIFNYRMGVYYQKIGEELEADKCFAFVIANGKNHHTALRAKTMFKGLVNPEDFVYVPSAPDATVVDSQTPETATPELSDVPTEKEEKEEEPKDE